jgi:hypothetical protein
LRFPLWVLLALPVVCAPLFFLARSNHASTSTIEDIWINRIGSEFPIRDGDFASWGEEVLYIASVSGPDVFGYHHRVVRSLRPAEELRIHVHAGNDTWVAMSSVPDEVRAKLAGRLRNLPPSAPPADLGKRVVVAFVAGGRWVVRSYSYPGPKEVDDLLKP